MSGRSSPDDDDLWRTLNEPDIDPKLAEGLSSNQNFARWWVHKFLPCVELDRLDKIEPNFTREKESASAQSKAGRETDLHIVVRDKAGDLYAILTESKIVAPPSLDQPDDYIKYARWGEREGKWRKAVTVMMAPEGYLERNRSSDRYDAKVTYETLHQAARSHSLFDLATYLKAGIIRYKRCGGEPRNPDDVIGGFRMQYAELLREESRELHSYLQARDKKMSDSSQRWFYFCPKLTLLSKRNVQVIHKICNRMKGPQDCSEEQVLSVHVPRTHGEHDAPPNWGTRDQWRSSKCFWIRDIPLDRGARLYFEDFDDNAARRVWGRASELIDNCSQPQDQP